MHVADMTSHVLQAAGWSRTAAVTGAKGVVVRVAGPLPVQMNGQNLQVLGP